MIKSFLRAVAQKKVTILGVVTLVLLFVTGCSNDSGAGGNNSGSLNKGGDGLNKPVTYDSLDWFIAEFNYAYYGNKTYAANKSRAALPDEYGEEESSGNETYKVYGDACGYAEVVSDYSDYEDWRYALNYDSETEKEYELCSVKYFDFSNSDRLFLGGSIVMSYNYTYNYKYDYDTYDEFEKEVRILKFNGTINFQGVYKGKIVFDNVTYDDMHGRISSGRLYIESGGKKIDFEDYLYGGFWIPYSNRDNEFGDRSITVKMPSVPTAPNGVLNELLHANAPVDLTNAVEFFMIFVDEFNKSGSMPRANEDKLSWEYLNHGIKSGYYSEKYNDLCQTNNSGSYYSSTKTTEYNDYSNTGALYLGGGFAKAMSAFYKYSDNPPYSAIERDTTIINGKVKFNGEFKGELNFASFKFFHEYSNSQISPERHDYRHIGGSVKIGSLDVTNEYVEYVLKR